MFAYLKGILEAKTMDYVIIDIGGVGYKVYMSENSMKRIGEIESTVKVHTYVKVREDDISIYGFASNEELRMFELLLSVSGIGAKSAISILSNIEPSTFALAVVSDDVNVLKKLPGIGAKSAQRIILELKDKLKSMSVDDSTDVNDCKNVDMNGENLDDLISALQVLGYSRKEIENILPKLDSQDKGLEELIKMALTLLSK